jgi:hypothetical protein
LIVEFTAALRTDLALLTEAVDEPGLDLVRTLQQLISVTRQAVDGYLGISLQLAAYGEPITLTALEVGVRPVDVGASLAWNPNQSSPLIRDTETLPKVIVYARTRAALRGLIAELRSLAGAGSAGVTIDEHLRLPTQPSGLPAIVVVSQAIGVLIGRGHTATEALGELDDRAVAEGLARIDIAHRVVQNSQQPPGATA